MISTFSPTRTSALPRSLQWPAESTKAGELALRPANVTSAPEHGVLPPSRTAPFRLLSILSSTGSVVPLKSEVVVH